FLFGWMNMREPPTRHARTDTGTAWSIATVFCRIAEKATYAVISLVSEAGSMRSSALRVAIGSPLDTSMSTHARAAIAGGWGAWAAAAPQRETKRKKSETTRKRDIDAASEEKRIIPAL